VEIRLAPGWHTYWRYPGDAGVPPHFDFSKSRNADAVAVLWPAPARIPEQGLTVLGYHDGVVLPLLITQKEAAKPVSLHVELDYAVCEKLCVPVHGAGQLQLGSNSVGNAALAAAELKVPQRRVLGEGTRLAIRSVRREENAQPSRLVVDVAAPPGTRVDLIAEGPTPQWALPLPTLAKQQPNEAASPGLQRFTFELDGAPPGAQYEGANITLTAVAGDQAIEVVTAIK
jgi:DsbC/DsbD-like thiol-disulfide interchange protein